jgi:signal transduction histidine kinase
LIADTQKSEGPEIEFCDDLASAEPRPVLRVAVLCIVRELLLNACCYSRSRRILVGIGQDDTHIYIQVQDWGIGFDCAAVSPNRRGLNGVRELVRRLGGTVDIDTRLGQGTCISVEIPVLKQDGQAGSVARD